MPRAVRQRCSRRGFSRFTASDQFSGVSRSVPGKGGKEGVRDKQDELQGSTLPAILVEGEVPLGRAPRCRLVAATLDAEGRKITTASLAPASPPGRPMHIYSPVASKVWQPSLITAGEVCSQERSSRGSTSSTK